ncbi:MAG TPA: hypothetical protein VMF59_01870 [Bacteroidota bacterium]|nr:hypothetical protein [Bacteroidota bacterium]
MKKEQHAPRRAPESAGRSFRQVNYIRGVIIVVAVLLTSVLVFVAIRIPSPPPGLRSGAPEPRAAAVYHPTEKWIQRAYAIDVLFHEVYTPCWEGAYGAMGDAHLFAVTGDSALFRFYMVSHPLTEMCRQTWIDDQAWVCLAERDWWTFTGKTSMALVADAVRRYTEARESGALSSVEGFWSWYNFPPNTPGQQQIFTNSNMNEMASVACWLYEVTRERHFLDDALLVWNGDASAPGVEKTYYRGGGRWVGKPGLAAFGDPLPWKGAGYCTIAASLYRATGEERYKTIAVATARRVMDPAAGLVDPVDFYQVRMDGGGAFTNFLLDAYQLAPGELKEIPLKVEKSLEYVWTNAHGKASVVLHRESDHGIRNGWNGKGGEDGYRVGEVGTVHAQGEAVRAFGLYAYIVNSPALPKPGGP